MNAQSLILHYFIGTAHCLTYIICLIPGDSQGLVPSLGEGQGSALQAESPFLAAAL